MSKNRVITDIKGILKNFVRVIHFSSSTKNTRDIFHWTSGIFVWKAVVDWEIASLHSKLFAIKLLNAFMLQLKKCNSKNHYQITWTMVQESETLWMLNQELERWRATCFRTIQHYSVIFYKKKLLRSSL